MNNKLDAPPVIQHRITKVNGQIGFKKYKRGKLLGIGAFAKYYECINLESQKSFAIKVISKKQLDQDDKKEKVLSEIKIHKTLHHENIVKFDNAFQDLQNIYIVAELCSNDSLLDMMKKKGKISLKDARKYIIQIIRAVEYMHQNQVIHRDLKLANIFLNETMQIKVGDFGEATKLQFADEKKISVCGTLNYLAPEIVSGPFGHSYEVDFWAIGVISFAMLFGKSPFQSKDEDETLQRIKQCKYEFPNVAVPSEAKDFIKRILVRDPKERMNLQQMLQHPYLQKSQYPTQKSTKSQSILSSLPTQETLKQNHKHSFFERLKTKSNLFLKLDNLVNKDSFLKSTKTPRQTQKPLLKQIFGSKKNQKKNNQNKQYVITSIDMTKSSGLGYLINNQIYGVYFNDNTVLSCDENKKKIYFIKNPKMQSARVEEYSIENLPKDRDFQKKYILLDHFIGQLKIWSMKNTQNMIQVLPFEKLVYVKQWWKNSQATMFSLSNEQFQVSFVDGSCTVFDPSKNTILLKSKDGKKSFFEKIGDVMSSQNSEQKKMGLYTKQIFVSIQNKKKKMNSNLTR